MIDKYKLNTVGKVRGLYGVYRQFLYETVGELDCEICEIPASANDPESLAEFRTEMPQKGWEKAEKGRKWGGDYCYAWFKAEYTVPEELAKKELLLRADCGAPETLLFLNGKPAGLFDICGGIGGERWHEVQPLTFCAKAGESFQIAAECYAGHPLCGCMVYESENYIEGRMYPKDTVRTYSGIQIVVCNKEIAEFLMLHRIVFQMFDILPKDGAQYAQAVNALYDVFSVLPQRPNESYEDWRQGIKEAIAILKKVTDKRSDDGETLGYVGLIGHSHLDTAWLWPVRETLHKAARTFSNALRLMEHYPDYKFIQSSVLYIDWMKKYYPSIYDGIKQRVAEGRWEPNGGTWVECDDNIPSGEYIIRQFMKGQRYTKENLDYMADCFWQPDTFGYSAALPQILKGCGIDYFLTTKLSWNEANRFPYDTFIWRGIDGSEVLTHFNMIHKWPDFKSIRGDALDMMQNKDVSDMKLLSYGFGDGGGGPTYGMQECEKVVRGMAGMPKTENTTVSAFMERLSKTVKEPPVFSGELYLELHRGTLTQAHDIKRSNRNLEKAIHNAEIIGIITGKGEKERIDSALDTLLLNHFHDILPGTSISQVTDVAVYQNNKAANGLNEDICSMLKNGDDEGFVLCNTLSWNRNDQITADYCGKLPEGCVAQKYTDLEGKEKLAFKAKELSSLAMGFVPFGNAVEEESPFKVEGEKITTPFAEIILKKGEIVSYITNNGFQVVRNIEAPLNRLYLGDDIPLLWDNWDIDYDNKLKMKPVNNLLDYEVVSCGALQLRIRTKRAVSDKTVLKQDMIFYADSPRIDFETELDWNEVHKLLKVGFDVNVMSSTARSEIQFGNIKRPTHENYATDKSQFEVCNHKWTDLSDNRFGVAILNDCKYGISVDGSDLRLTLHKGGCHPDPRGDIGKHSFTYSLLVHESGFSTDSVIKPAYELNYPIIAVNGAKPCDKMLSSMFSVDAENVIIETVKPAEDGNGVILRLYETEGCFALCNLKSDYDMDKAFETDMLEYKDELLKNTTLNFKPFEIKTLRILFK